MQTNPVAAAQYLRMSTEMQQYSLDNQAAAIARYAQEHGFQIVKTYSDTGKSGLTLRHRAALLDLLNDVTSSRDPGFKAILVYDVSRWGRFQDVDEAAHYEYLCRSVGIPVLYCAETFENDPTLPNMLMKYLKRVMASEYSRELGVKVCAGMKRLAAMGFKQGGAPGYGLRRMLVSAQRQPKQQLDAGERKSIVNDRVILVPGPDHEVETVREIYRMFISGRCSFRAIAADLNRRGITFTDGGTWDRQSVEKVLTHPKYAGFHVFGRTSQRLHGKVKQLPRAEWSLTQDAYEPLVPISTFIQAQRVWLQRAHHKADQHLLDDLRSLLSREGRLSVRIIERDADTVCAATYRYRFGSIRRAYELIGYGQAEDFGAIAAKRRRIANMGLELMSRVQAICGDRVSVVRPSSQHRKRLLLIDNCIRVSVLVCRSMRTGPNALSWSVYQPPTERDLITFVAKLNEDNASFRDFYVVPRVNRKRFAASMKHAWLNDARTLVNLADFCDVVQQVYRAGTGIDTAGET